MRKVGLFPHWGPAGLPELVRGQRPPSPANEVRTPGALAAAVAVVQSSNHSWARADRQPPQPQPQPQSLPLPPPAVVPMSYSDVENCCPRKTIFFWVISEDAGFYLCAWIYVMAFKKAIREPIVEFYRL